MTYIAISINSYIKIHLENNPNEKEIDLRNRINKAIDDSMNGIKCNCGNSIWVIGSASVGNSCYTCITGESQPDDDYEIDSVLKQKEGLNSGINIDEPTSKQINGFFDDDGNEVNLDFITKPSLCISCVNNNNPDEELLCGMTRFDQKDDDEFICFAYVNLKDIK